MALIQSPLGILLALVLAAVAAEVLGKVRYGRALGPALIVIILGALLANLRLIPPAGAGGPVYDAVFAVVMPAAIFLVLLEANLKALKRAGGPMMIAFFIGAAGTVAGVLAAIALTPARAMLGDKLAALSGMYAGTYIGGSANFNAIALHFGVARDGGLYTAAVVADNVLTGFWVVATLALPLLLLKTGLFGARRVAVAAVPADAAAAPPPPLTGVLAVAAPVAVALAGVLASDLLAGLLARLGAPVPSVIILTTLALIVAQTPFVHRMTLGRPMGLAAIYLFLAVVGASADVGALIAAGPVGLMLMAFVGIIVLVHAAILIVAGWLLRIDPDIIAIASNANIGGASSALSLAESLGREDLALSAVLAGTVGTAIGTYIGFMVAGIL